MKVLFLTDASPIRPASGSEQVIYRQATGLHQQGLDVRVISRRNGPSTDVQYNRIAGVREACYSVDVKNYFRFLNSLFRITPQLFDNFKGKVPFSAFIVHQPFTCLPLLIRGRLKNTPLIYVFHSPNHEEYLIANRNGGKSFFQAQIRKRIEGYCLQRSKKIIVLSRYMKQKVVHTHGIDEARILVIPGGADLVQFKPPANRRELKQELGLPVDRIHLLTVRNLEPRMGLDNLLEAMRLLKGNIRAPHLIIGGNGPERSNIEKLVNRYELTNDIDLTGFIPAELLSKYYGAADFFILPTHRLEGFGLVTAESLACGTPVLGTPVGGTTEILSKLEPRLLFKRSTPDAIADGITMAIRTFYDDNEKYEKLRIKCREHAEKKYSWQRHVDQLRLIINDLVNNDV